MPRLRYYKRFEAINEDKCEQEFEESRPYEELCGQQPSGQSWWSNRNIITGLSDAKIKQAIGYHKQMVTFLEKELCSRTIGSRKYEPFSISKSGNTIIKDPIVLGTRKSKKKTNVICGTLRPILSNIKRKHGTLAAEKVKKEWEIILQQYRKGA